VQRLFSTFPEGSPGIGLVLLRLAIAIPLIHQATAGLLNGTWLAPLVLVAAGAALLLLVGLWTPLAGAIVAAAAFGFTVSHPAEAGTFLHFGMLGAALALLGPGAWSVDARLFGRKNIQIP
jgi:uncharacterized membrane protein YphA (DoxX/SURF4 family)